MGEQANYRPGTNPGPPWPTVVATTVRLWLRRGTRGTLFRRHRVAALTVLAATALVAGGLAIALTRQAGAAPASGVEAAQGGAGPVARSPIPTGQYTVAMRDSGAPANTPPTLSASVQVTPGMAYTIVSMGPASHLGVQVLKETMMSSPGKALVRIVQESVAQHRVSVNDGSRALGGPLELGSYTGFLKVSPGWQAIHATGYSATATKHVLLRANTIHTLVVLDNEGGLRIHSLQDAVGSGTMPAGGAATGLGGTAPKPGASPAPWLAIMAGGGLLAAMGTIRLRRNRRRAAHAVTER